MNTALRSWRYAWSIAPLLAALLLAGPAHAVQASGSLLVVPDDWGPLAQDEEVDVAILARNSSSDTPAASVPDGTDPVPATLAGPVVVTLACQDPMCATQAAGKMAFVPVGATGCVSQNAAVATCSAGPGNTVDIVFNGTITLPPDGTVGVATIRVKMVDVANVTRLGIQASSLPASLSACSTSSPTTCAMCMADGCTLVVVQQGVNTVACPHACPSKIRFIGDGAQPDSLEVHAILSPAGAFDPMSQSLTITLSNALFNPVLTFTLPPGSLVQQGTTYAYRDNDADDLGGIGYVRLSLRDGGMNEYKIDIRAFDANLEARATVPVMTVDMTVGGETFSFTAPWEPRSFGWQLTAIP